MPPAAKFPTTIAEYRADVMVAFGACQEALDFVDAFVAANPGASLQDLFAEWANPDVPASWAVWNAWIFHTEFGTKISGAVAQFLMETLGERILAGESRGQLQDVYTYLEPYMPAGYKTRFQEALGLI